MQMMDRRTTSTIVLAVLLIASLTGNVYQAFLQPSSEEQTIADLQRKIDSLDARVLTLQNAANGSPASRSATLQGPAVLQSIQADERYPYWMGEVVTRGAMLDISVEIQPGQGRVLVETEPLMGIVFQDAANTAVRVAENVTDRSLSASDVIFSIRADAEVPAVDGPSAGALMAALAIAALNGETPDSSVTLTGTIDAGGHVGAIGGVLEKSQAAKESGKRIILLPRENAELVQLVETTQRFGRFTRVYQQPVVVDAKEYIESEVGIQVGYVDTIEDVGRALGILSA